MTYIVPIPLPSTLPTERGVVAKNDFSHEHHAVRFTADGRGYIHSEVFYNYRRYKQGDDDLSAIVVTVLDREFSITRQVWLEDLYADMTRVPRKSRKRGDDPTEHVFNNAIQPLAVADGHLVFTTEQNRTFVLDGELRRVARYDPLLGEAAGFSDVVAVPNGLVVMRDRARIGVTRIASLTKALPQVRELGTVEDLVGDLTYGSYVGRFEAIDLDRILVAQFVKRSRSGWIDPTEFAYTIIDGKGAVVKRLPLGAAGTPYGKLSHVDSHVAHRRLDGWCVRSDAALQVFDRDGKRIARIALDRFDAIVPLALLAVGPAGELVMVSKKHHLMVVSDPIDDVAKIEPALADIQAVYAAEHARLKKAVSFASNRWFGWEHETPRATAASAAKPKKATTPKPVKDVRAPAAPKTVAEAVATAPDDVDTLSIYADSLGDSKLGEYIQTSIGAHRARAGSDERARYERQASELFRVHGTAWMRTWNTPLPLFDPQFERFCGLPRTLRLEGLPKKHATIDKQVASLPIQLLSMSHVSASDLAALGSLATLRRVSSFELFADSKHKLSKQALSWLAEQQLASLEALWLTSVAATGGELRAVVDSMPRLTALGVSDAGLSPEGLAVLAESGAAKRIEELKLDFNPLGSSSAPILARFTKLRVLDLHSVDLGDDLAEEPVPHITASSVDLGDNERLGAAGLAWLVKALPALEDVRLPSTLTVDALKKLAPILPRLRSIDAWGMEAATARVLVKMLAKATGLRALGFGGTDAGVARAIVEHTKPVKLKLGDVDDADLAALARADTLQELVVGGVSDANIAAFARAKLPALHTLEIRSRSFGDAGLAEVLDAPWPHFTRLKLKHAKIRDTSRLQPPRDRPFTLELSSCGVPRAQADRLRHAWGDRIVISS